MLVEICFFNIFFALKLKKGRKSKKFDVKYSKKCVFKVCTRTQVACFVPRKIEQKKHGLVDSSKLVDMQKLVNYLRGRFEIVFFQ